MKKLVRALNKALKASDDLLSLIEKLLVLARTEGRAWAYS